MQAFGLDRGCAKAGASRFENTCERRAGRARSMRRFQPQDKVPRGTVRAGEGLRPILASKAASLFGVRVRRCVPDLSCSSTRDPLARLGTPSPDHHAPPFNHARR